MRRTAVRKIKRKESLRLELVPNPDILGRAARAKRAGQLAVGFSIETHDLENRARQKLVRKNLDYIVASPLDSGSGPFGRNRMQPLILCRNKKKRRYKSVTKRVLARDLIRLIDRGL